MGIALLIVGTLFAGLLGAAAAWFAMSCIEQMIDQAVDRALTIHRRMGERT